MSVAVSNRVSVRSSMGQFIAACEEGATATVREAIQRGERMSADMAPRGRRMDPRTVSIVGGMFSKMTSSTSGVWGSTARHALAQEFGGRAHTQTGDVSFFWEKPWRMWEPGDNEIQHPGNPAHPYLRPAYEAVMGQVMQIARDKYPG